MADEWLCNFVSGINPVVVSIDDVKLVLVAVVTLVSIALMSVEVND